MAFPLEARLQAGIAAARAGQAQQARALLMRVVWRTRLYERLLGHERHE